MADDQTLKPKSQPQEPFYQDELDVLEAVAKLEKKYGKTFLTEEQRGKLEGARKYLQKSDSLSGQGSNLKEIDKAADVVMISLKLVIERIVIEVVKYCSWDEWNGKSRDLRGAILSLYTYMFFGVKEEELKQRLVVRFGGAI